MKRRILASLLSLVMMLSLLPTAVWAVDDEGSTSSGNGWPSGATGITVATEKYSVKDYDEDKTNVTASIRFGIRSIAIPSPLAVKVPFPIIPTRLN